MNAHFGMLLLLPALVAALPQATQETKPAPSKPEVTVVTEQKGDAADKPRKTVLTPEQIKLLSADPALAGSNGMRIINGALYHLIGGQLLPLPGGGASGCLDVNGAATKAKIAAAKLELIKQVAATEAKAPEQK